MVRRVLTLDGEIQGANDLAQVRKSELERGDVCVARTMNSLYHIRVLGGGFYSVTGGWFSSKGCDGSTTGINGCTWGGSVIKTDIVAACGLCIEFGNRVVTSPIRVVAVFHWWAAN